MHIIAAQAMKSSQKAHKTHARLSKQAPKQGEHMAIRGKDWLSYKAVSKHAQIVGLQPLQQALAGCALYTRTAHSKSGMQQCSNVQRT
jgi:hypothetical protein